MPARKLRGLETFISQVFSESYLVLAPPRSIVAPPATGITGSLVQLYSYLPTAPLLLAAAFQASGVHLLVKSPTLFISKRRFLFIGPRPRQKLTFSLHFSFARSLVSWILQVSQRKGQR